MYPLESLDPLFLTRLDYHWGAGIRRKLKEEGQGPLEKVFLFAESHREAVAEA